MKISFLFSLLAASAVYGVAIPHSDAPLTKEVLAKRQFQFIGTVTSLLGTLAIAALLRSLLTRANSVR